MPLFRTSLEVSLKLSLGCDASFCSHIGWKKILFNTGLGGELQVTFPASRFVFPSSCRGGKGSYKKAGRTNAGLCKCEVLPGSWVGWMPSGSF